MFSPSRLQAQSEFYHQLGTLLGAGVSPLAAFEHLRQSPPCRELGQAASSILESLNRGSTLTEASRKLAGTFPRFDQALIEAGEESGRIDHIVIALAKAYQEQASLLRNALSQLAYPVLILHAGVFISPLPSLVLTGNVPRYLGATLGVLLPLYALTACTIAAWDSRRGDAVRAALEQIARRVPLLGNARRSIALSRFALALGALLNAGVSVVHAWSIAAEACGSPALRKAVLARLPELERGAITPSELAEQTAEFPSLFATSLRTAEISGKIDDTLARLQKYFADEGSRQLTAFATMAPRIFYILILFVLGAQILSSYRAQQANLPGF